VILEIDAGNSRFKWRVVDPVGAESFLGVRAGSIEDLIMITGGKGIERVRISSVRSAADNAILSEVIQRSFGVAPEFAQSLQICGGVTNGYRRAEKLGVDRWMAMLAGRHLAGGQAYIVVDAGSAITIDFVNNNGEHEGGYIVPGLQLQVASLLRGTAMEIRNEAYWGELEPGRDTEIAIRNGILCMVCQWIAAVTCDRRMHAGRILLTGGDGSLLSENLRSISLVHEYLPDLVLDGLRVALP